jgi:perosamine synthetase
MKSIIGIHEPYFVGKEKKYVIDCLNSGWVSSSGKYLELLKKKIYKLTKANYVLPVVSGTAGLHLSLITAGVKNGDEVILPTISFIATANVVRYVDADPIFVGVDKFLNIDEEKCVEFLKSKTYQKKNKCINKISGKTIKAIIIVHAFGNAAKFEKLFQLCKSKKIKIIEDAAEGLGTVYTKNKFKRKHTGTLGEFGVISFNGNKIITGGNGGVLLIDKKKDYIKAKYIANQAKDDKINFTHNSIGYNYTMSNLTASIIVAQLEKINFFLEKKLNIHKNYKKIFKNINGLEVLDGPNYAKNNYWLNLILIKKNIKIKSKLFSGKFQIRPVWKPLNLQKMFKNYLKINVKNTENLHNKYVCLPSSAFLNKKQINDIAKFATKILK